MSTYSLRLDYPGYTVQATIGPLLVRTVHGLVEGGVSEALIAWFYNCLAGA